MDYEKKYKGALERAREMCAMPTDRATMEYIFPELKESEDGQHRKWILEYLYDGLRKTDEQFKPQFKSAIAWLEKQCEPNPYSGVSFKYNGHVWGMCARDNGVEILFDGELKAFLSLEKSFIYPIYPKIDLAHIAHKSALEATKEEKVDNQICIKPSEDVEPKFKVGDWITDGEKVWKIGYIENDMYIEHRGTISAGGAIKNIDKHYHLWTIQDAKDGDVLVCNGDIKYSNGIKYERICLFKNFDSAFFTLTKTSNYVEECGIDVNIDYPDNTVPATKEQKEILLMVMKDAGYKWDAEKNELKKIEPKKLNADEVIEWLYDQACQGWIEDVEVEKFVEQFKKDFEQ